jgi:hypothetical protein
MKTYWMSGDVWRKVHRRLIENNDSLYGENSNYVPVTVHTTEIFLEKEYGLRVMICEDMVQDQYEYEVLNEELLTAFLLRWG